MTALLTDLYQLAMMRAYLDRGMEEPAVFELFVRKLPAQRNFLVAAGLEQALEFVHLQTLIASKAARIVLSTEGRQLIDFGMRRAHGAEAALFAARSAWLAGFDGTATAEAGRRFGIPAFGTMAHSFVQAHHDERDAFEAFARARPQRPVMLVDTYDTEAAVAKVIALYPALAAEGIRIAGVRLDSSDLAAHARAVRAMLDRAGRRLPGQPALEAARTHARAQLARLPPALRALAPAAVPVAVEISQALRALASEIDAAAS
ncbi:MAG: hypothetical protein J0H00_11730 [Burkholderiales bacterium]|nr:hypothetical protein [Burkholderiales bacterium]OJX03215.1 MAG: hypothetical protein BGO72_18330 [Burkholderiales bacterium 70-64]